VRKVAPALAALLLLPVLVAGAATGSGELAVADVSALGEIPPTYGRLYVEAASRFGFDWQLLAAVGKVECDHGRGDCYRPNAAGARGPMQFMPATWEVYARSSNDPPYDVYDPRDAIFGAAAKLSANGIARHPRRALFSYNHSDSYVDEVITWAIRYGWMTQDPAAIADAVLTHPNITLRPEARADIESGIVDGRVLGALLALASRHSLDSVGPFVTGHSVYVKGTTRVSNHAVGRAVDIPVIDGVAVSASNQQARNAARIALSLEEPLRPDELGSPWDLSSTTIATFTKDHHDHLHLGFELGGS
jgi:Transglycosylase SLT domain